jgi:hypothetical protein
MAPKSIQSWVEYEEQMDRRQRAIERAGLLLETPAPIRCAVCHSTQQTVMLDRTLGIGDVCCVLEDDEPPCECVPIDVDQDDACFCPLHGPHSEFARQCREREVAHIAAYYSPLEPIEGEF